MKYYILATFIVFITSQVSAAPLPGTTSSRLTAPKLGLYKSRVGFEIKAHRTSWIQTKPPKKSRFIETVYRSPNMRNNTRATLTVRTDKLKRATKIRQYVRRWVKEYPKYGYDVLGSKRFKSRGKTGYVIDLINNKKKRQLRQVIYLRKKTAVLLTCRDHVENFGSSLKECNQIIKNFAWL